jgi:uncharacterized protein (TIGR03067 family)
MRTHLVIASAVLAFGFAPAPFPRTERRPDPRAADLARMQGTWKMVRRVMGGQDGPVGKVHVVIAGSRFTYKESNMNYHITLDARAWPRVMRTEWPDKNGKEKDVAVYAIDGDTLRLCWPLGVPESEKLVPPASIGPGPRREFMEFRRVRP